MPLDLRRRSTFGGLVPSAAVARGGDTLVAALAVEHHTDGAAIPMLILSDAPGLLEWRPESGLEAVDDAGPPYEVRALWLMAGLGALGATLWLEPPPRSQARRLGLRVDGLARRPPARGGGSGAPRPVAGGPWSLEIDLLPPRTAAAVPPPSRRPVPDGSTARIPARARSAFLGLLPVGQARVDEDRAVALMAIERYTDRAVLTVGLLSDREPLTRLGTRDRVEVWDDRGGRYAATPIHEAAGDGWGEVGVELVPAPAREARALGIRVPGGRAPAAFGVALEPGGP